MIIITLMIVMIKTTIIVILYCLKRNTNGKVKLRVIYISWSKTIRLQLYSLLPVNYYLKKKILNSVKVTFKINLKVISKKNLQFFFQVKKSLFDLKSGFTQFSKSKPFSSL